MTNVEAIKVLKTIKECRMAKLIDDCCEDCDNCEYYADAFEVSDACDIAISEIEFIAEMEL